MSANDGRDPAHAVAREICSLILLLAGAGVAVYAIGPGENDVGWIAALLIIVGLMYD